MAGKTIIEKLNARGFARGWHAQMLQGRAERRGVTMSALFCEEIRGKSAYNFLAEAVSLSRGKVTFRFLDGSTLTTAIPNGVSA
jgi:hypothetical protein